jgi:hypothetical protein
MREFDSIGRSTAIMLGTFSFFNAFFEASK